MCEHRNVKRADVGEAWYCNACGEAFYPAERLGEYSEQQVALITNVAAEFVSRTLTKFAVAADEQQEAPAQPASAEEAQDWPFLGEPEGED